MNDSIIEVVAGAASGALSKTVMAPLDRLKLVVQLRGEIPGNGGGGVSSIQTSQHHQYAGPIMALRKMVHEEGVWALWRGNATTIWIQGGSSALSFLFMDVWKGVFSTTTEHKNHHTRSFGAAALGGATSMTLLYPLGLVRTKLALDMGNGPDERKYRGMRDVVVDSVRTNGWTSLFRGYGVALISVTMYRMIHLGGYEVIKKEILDRRRSHHLNVDKSGSILWWERLAAAQGVSMTASTVHYPLDSVRRRLMMQSDAQERRYKSAMDCVQKIYHFEGIAGFYRGLGTSYIRSVSAAFLLVSYDFFKVLLAEPGTRNIG